MREETIIMKTIKELIYKYIRLNLPYDKVEEQLYFKSCNVNHFDEIKYFHPSCNTLPNGSHFQKGGYLNECRINKNSFIINEDIHPEQYGLSNYRGGIIVFAVNVNAVQLSSNKIMNCIKQFMTTWKNRLRKDKMLADIINDFNNSEDNTENDYIGAYSVGKFFNGKYVGDNGETFNDKSVSIEINGLSSKGLLLLGEYITKKFQQETVLIKDLNYNKIYLANKERFTGSSELLKQKLDKLNNGIR